MCFVVVMRKMADRIQWKALRKACKDLGINTIDSVVDFNSGGYIKEGDKGNHVFDNATSSSDAVAEEDLKALHHVLFEVHVQEGELVCPESKRRFLVKDGIPNMLLHEDEVGPAEVSPVETNTR